MKSLIAIPLVLAGASADAFAPGHELRRRLNDKAMYDLKAGSTCAEGYEPLTTSWKDCAKAAMALGFEGDDVANAKYNKPWGTKRPQGCFRKGNGEFHFNDGIGGGAKRNDKILCVLEGQGPSNRDAASTVEGDGTLDTSLEEFGPEVDDDTPIVNDENDLDSLETVVHEMGEVDEMESAPPNSTEFLRFYTEEEGWTSEQDPQRRLCGGKPRKRVTSTTNMPWRWMAHLEIQNANGGWNMCSAFFISKRVLITAGHCVYMHDDGGWVRRVKVCPGRHSKHSMPYGCQWVSEIHSVRGWTKDRTRMYDRAAIILPDTSMYNKGIGYFGFTSSLQGIWNVNFAGYPGDRAMGELWRNYDSYWTHGGRLYYWADEGAGMSGGPVWSKKGNERRIVGIHVHGGCPNGAVQVTNSVFDWMNDFRRRYG